MQPTDLTKIRSLSSPTVDPGGVHVVFAVATPDTDANTYVSSLWRLPIARGEAKRLTEGESDSSPAYSPDGHTIAFLRGDDKKRPQLWVLPADGGDGRPLTEAPLGVSSFAWSPDSAKIAYAARVPEQGRYGTDDDVSAEQEAPRLIEHVGYLADGLGYALDRPSKIFTVDVGSGVESVNQVTTGGGDDQSPCWLDGGARIGFVASRDRRGRWKPDSLVSDLFSITPAGKGIRRLTDGSGTIASVVTDAAATQAYYLANDLGPSHQDFVGRNFVWRKLGDDTPLTDAETDHAVGVATIEGNRLLGVFETRGTAVLREIGGSGASVLGGDRNVTAVGSAGGVIAAVAADGASYGELYVGKGTRLRKRTDFAAELTGSAAPLEKSELTATSGDGYPVHGWVIKPRGKGPHPVVLMIHGGPYAQYTSAVFDEAEVLAGAGYAVVMCNPRGGAGYGASHGRVLKDAIGTVDVADLLAFLDEALKDRDLDNDRVGIMGGSYGGLMTTWILGHTDRFVAGISERAVNAWDSFAGTSDIGWFFADEYAGDRQYAQSPLTHADQITTPLMIIHSERDFRCPLEQGQRLFALLKKRGVPTKLLVFPGEGHELSRSGQPRHRLQRFEHILDWWSHYLPVGKGSRKAKSKGKA
ncbi:alpha/beta fold hydrolase [Epidermidibacterium keratini]|uniref:Alpha/beta fold hydrolase n=1 Tax=Epidermidibacterium keratini TaxID=1891644 RepID=A0A7L4YSE3_9ACTN|nr:S9 family peptidase [Epidermidibacterium keratini]QHC02000.1 alpha/beta fold hydrolase [Epidermidibacterium keratini]